MAGSCKPDWLGMRYIYVPYIYFYANQKQSINYGWNFSFQLILKVHLLQRCVHSLLLCCNAVALLMNRFLIYSSSTQRIAHLVHSLAVPQWSSRRRDGDTASAPNCNAAAVDYKCILRCFEYTCILCQHITVMKPPLTPEDLLLVG